MLPRDQGLAQSRLVEAEHTRVPPNLVDKGLQQDALGAGLHVHGPEGRAHPPGQATGRRGGGRARRPERPRLSSVCVGVSGLRSLVAHNRMLCGKQTAAGVGSDLGTNRICLRAEALHLQQQDQQTQLTLYGPPPPQIQTKLLGGAEGYP